MVVAGRAAGAKESNDAPARDEEKGGHGTASFSLLAVSLGRRATLAERGTDGRGPGFQFQTRHQFAALRCVARAPEKVDGSREKRPGEYPKD